MAIPAKPSRLYAPGAAIAAKSTSRAPSTVGNTTHPSTSTKRKLKGTLLILPKRPSTHANPTHLARLSYLVPLALYHLRRLPTPTSQCTPIPPTRPDLLGLPTRHRRILSLHHHLHSLALLLRHHTVFANINTKQQQLWTKQSPPGHISKSNATTNGANNDDNTSPSALSTVHTTAHNQDSLHRSIKAILLLINKHLRALIPLKPRLALRYSPGHDWNAAWEWFFWGTVCEWSLPRMGMAVVEVRKIRNAEQMAWGEGVVGVWEVIRM